MSITTISIELQLHYKIFSRAVLFNLIPILKKATPVIKKDLLYIFPYGPCTWLCGAFFVDRSSPKAAYETLAHCAKEMTEKKVINLSLGLHFITWNGNNGFCDIICR